MTKLNLHCCLCRKQEQPQENKKEHYSEQDKSVVAIRRFFVTRKRQTAAFEWLAVKDTAAKTKPLISKENAQNRPETIQRETVLGISAFREQIGNSAVKRRCSLCPVCRNTSRKNGRSFLMSVAGRNTTSFAGNAKGAASSVSYYQRQYFNASSAVERLQERYDRLKEKCQPFLQELEHFPKLVEVFVKKVKELFSIKEAQERKEREDRAAARK